MPSIIGKCKLFRIKHITLLEGETFLRNKHEIAFFEIKCTFFGRKENTIRHLRDVVCRLLYYKLKLFGINSHTRCKRKFHSNNSSKKNNYLPPLYCLAFIIFFELIGSINKKLLYTHCMRCSKPHILLTGKNKQNRLLDCLTHSFMVTMGFQSLPLLSS